MRAVLFALPLAAGRRSGACRAGPPPSPEAIAAPARTHRSGDGRPADRMMLGAVQGAPEHAGRRDRGGGRGPRADCRRQAPRRSASETRMSSATSTPADRGEPPGHAGGHEGRCGRPSGDDGGACPKRSASWSARPPTCLDPIIRSADAAAPRRSALARAKAALPCGSCSNSRFVPFPARSGWSSAEKGVAA